MKARYADNDLFKTFVVVSCAGGQIEVNVSYIVSPCLTELCTLYAYS